MPKFKVILESRAVIQSSIEVEAEDYYEAMDKVESRDRTDERFDPKNLVWEFKDLPMYLDEYWVVDAEEEEDA
jgi:hypothetical protein